MVDTAHNGQRTPLFPEAINPLVDLQQRLQRLETAQATATRQQQETQAAGLALHQLTHDTLARLRTWRHAPAWVWGLVGTSLGSSALLTFLLLASPGQRRPQLAYEQILGAVDAVLVQSYATLPKATQEQLSATYARLGLQSPAQRQPGKK